MSCCNVEHKSSPEELERSKQIDMMMKQERKKNNNRIKLLLLGCGNSGKSTFLKQMKIINTKGFSKPEQERYRVVLRDNCLKTICLLVDEAMQNDFYKFPKKLKRYADIVLNKEELDESACDAIEKLWSSKVIQHVWDNRSSLQVESGGNYYIEHCRRFAEDDYIPNVDDILRSRMRTTGIIELKFDLDGTEVIIVDVGGQRSERRKWIHCFDDVTAVIYLTALDEYDMKLVEDSRTNRMMESLKLFSEITSSMYFKNTSVMLFLNKTDLLQEKIKKKTLKCLFPEYDGGSDFDKAVSFIEEKFKDSFGSTEDLYVKHTCAIDTQNIEHIFESLKDTILRNSFRAFEA